MGEQGTAGVDGSVPPGDGSTAAGPETAARRRRIGRRIGQVLLALLLVALLIWGVMFLRVHVLVPPAHRTA